MASQLPTTSSTTSSNELRRKIRDSCNNCGAQKIRCGKQRPSCSRCVQKSLPCSYSYSQRAGRRSSMATQRDGSHVASLPTVPGSPASITDANAMYRPALPLTTTTSACQALVLTASMDNPLDYDQSPFDDADPFANLTFDFLTTSPHPGTMTSLSGVSNAPATSGTTDPAHFIESEAFWQSLPSIPERNHDVLKSVSSHPIFDQDQVAAFRRSMEETTPRRHDCMQLALKVVSDLSVPREPCTVASSNSMAGIDGPNTEARDVDTVLFMNRDAAQSIKSILDCTCSSDQAVLLACYLATSKVVDWYSAAIEAVGEHLVSTDQATKGFSYKSTADTMAEKIITRPIYMGKYCLDSEVQRVIRAQVVLGELKEHIQPLLNSLPRFHVNSRDSEKESAAHIIQACALRNQLRVVVQKARNLNSTRSN